MTNEKLERDARKINSTMAAAAAFADYTKNSSLVRDGKRFELRHDKDEFYEMLIDGAPIFGIFCDDETDERAVRARFISHLYAEMLAGCICGTDFGDLDETRSQIIMYFESNGFSTDRVEEYMRVFSK